MARRLLAGVASEPGLGRVNHSARGYRLEALLDALRAHEGLGVIDSVRARERAEEQDAKAIQKDSK